MNCVICSSSSSGEPPKKKAKVESGSSEFCCAPCGHTFHRQCLYDYLQKEWEKMDALHRVFSQNSTEGEGGSGPCPICKVQIKKRLLYPFIPVGQGKNLDTVSMAMNILDTSGLDVDDPDDYWKVCQVMENVIVWGNAHDEEKKVASEALIQDIMTFTDPLLGLLFDADDEEEEEDANEEAENEPEATASEDGEKESGENVPESSANEAEESDSENETLDQLYSMICKDCKEKWDKSQEETQNESSGSEDEGNQSDTEETEDDKEDGKDEESPPESGNVSEAESL